MRLLQASSPSPAPQALVGYSSTSRPCWRKLVTAVNIRSTNRLPVALCVPKDFFRHNTARRERPLRIIARRLNLLDSHKSPERLLHPQNIRAGMARLLML